MGFTTDLQRTYIGFTYNRQQRKNWDNNLLFQKEKTPIFARKIGVNAL